MSILKTEKSQILLNPVDVRPLRVQYHNGLAQYGMGLTDIEF